MTEEMKAIVEMIENCPGVPRNPDSLPMMILAHAKAALSRPVGDVGSHTITSSFPTERNDVTTREALEEARKAVVLLEDLCACRGDDEYLAGVLRKIDSALSSSPAPLRMEGEAAKRVCIKAKQFCEELCEDAEGVPQLQLKELHDALDAWEGNNEHD